MVELLRRGRVEEKLDSPMESLQVALLADLQERQDTEAMKLIRDLGNKVVTMAATTISLALTIKYFLVNRIMHINMYPSPESCVNIKCY